MSATPVTARIAPGVASIPAAEWDACAGTGNPFVSHAFLSILERSGSATARTGWQPIPVIVDGADGTPAAIAPAYAKSHSQGEYVFDHAWADAWERAGGAYYPKLQIAAPFTPAPGPRLLLRDSALLNPGGTALRSHSNDPADRRNLELLRPLPHPATQQGILMGGRVGERAGAALKQESYAPALIAALEAVTDQHGLSSAHATFVEPDQLPLFEAAGWLIRAGTQFHWRNQNYAGFDDFLAALASRKRKAIRKERAAAVDGLTIRHVTGSDLTEADWDAFWMFYQDTGARKWGHPYLTRAFFSLLGERLADKVLLIFAERDGRAIAGALNLIGADTLYGRYWGCTEDVPFLHFELCYYQAIDAAIARGLSTVEAGAQGEHKLARGYEPVPTWSAHYIPDPNFRRAVAGFLKHEREAVAADRDFLGAMTPFRKA